MISRTAFKTVSEKIFADYLDEYSYDWDYEPHIPDKSKQPDFLIRHKGIDCLLDAKERSPKSAPEGARMFDPIHGVKKLIERGREKFAEYDDYQCSLVLYNNGDCDTRINPLCIFGAMLGEPGLTADFDPQSGAINDESSQNIFLDHGGKMIKHYKPPTLHDSTRNISSLIVPSVYRVPNPDFNRALKEEINKQQSVSGREFEGEERAKLAWEIAQETPIVIKQVHKVVVCTNPFARNPLPDSLFNGPYDERYSIQNGALRRIYAGSEYKEPERI